MSKYPVFRVSRAIAIRITNAAATDSGHEVCKRGLTANKSALNERLVIPAAGLDPRLIFVFGQWGNILRHPLSALGMILSFLSLGCLMLSGATLFQKFVAHQGSLRVDAWLAMGVGFFCGS